jgi:hypothetical protein
MSYSIYDNTMNTVAVTGPSPVYTTTNTGSISPGLYWGLNGTSAPNTVLTVNNTSGSSIFADPNLKGASIKVQGDAEFDGEVTIKGKNIADMFAKIEERLAILHPNPELEDKWDELKELGKRYKELEQEIIEKEKVWEILKK